MSKVKCLNCNTILHSKFRHDLQECGCVNQTFVDGGDDYMRSGGKNLYLVEVVNEEEKETDKKEMSIEEAITSLKESLEDRFFPDLYVSREALRLVIKTAEFYEKMLGELEKGLEELERQIESLENAAYERSEY